MLTKLKNKRFAILIRHTSICLVGLIAAALLYSTSSYGESEKDLIARAKTDTIRLLLDTDAEEDIKKFSPSHLSPQQLRSGISDATKRRAECHVDAMVRLVKEKPEGKLDMAILLGLLAGKDYVENMPLAMSYSIYYRFEEKKVPCDEEYSYAVARLLNL